MFLVLLVGCVPPSVIGVRSDGYVGPAGTIELSGGYGSSLRALDTSDADEQIGVAGGMVGYSVSDDVKVAAGVGFPSDAYTPTVEVTARLIGDEASPLTVSAIGGVAALVGGEPFQVAQGGVHGGAVASYEVAPDLRPYVGALGEVNRIGEEFSLFSDVSAGLTWRPQVAEGLGLLFLGEATWVHGALGETAYDVLTAEAMVGLTWTPAGR